MGKVLNCRPNRLNGANEAILYPECQKAGICQKPPKQIVIVDDDNDNLDEISQFLTYCGFTVYPHASPYQAFLFMKSYDFDVLLSDVEMPGMRGTQLAAWVSDRKPAVQVILISGLEIVAPELRDNWSFFRKPVELDLVRGAIEGRPVSEVLSPKQSD